MSFKVNELRVGNIITSKSTSIPWEVMPSDFERIFENESHYLPLLITKEWVLQFGFKKIKYSPYSYELGDCSINIKDFSFYIDVNEYCGYCIDDVRYVHKLQNIYFSFKNEELLNFGKK